MKSLLVPFYYFHTVYEGNGCVCEFAQLNVKGEPEVLSRQQFYPEKNLPPGPNFHAFSCLVIMFTRH